MGNYTALQVMLRGWCCGQLELLDEYQYQVPKQYVTMLPFSLEGIERQLNKKGEVESDEELAARIARDMAIKDRVMAGKPYFYEGNWYAIYSQVGELVVRCVEQAARMMFIPVHITGEYLVGRSWSECH